MWETDEVNEVEIRGVVGPSRYVLKALTVTKRHLYTIWYI